MTAVEKKCEYENVTRCGPRSLPLRPRARTKSNAAATFRRIAHSLTSNNADRDLLGKILHESHHFRRYFPPRDRQRPVDVEQGEDPWLFDIAAHSFFYLTYLFRIPSRDNKIRHRIDKSIPTGSDKVSRDSDQLTGCCCRSSWWLLSEERVEDRWSDRS